MHTIAFPLLFLVAILLTDQFLYLTRRLPVITSCRLFGVDVELYWRHSMRRFTDGSRWKCGWQYLDGELHAFFLVFTLSFSRAGAAQTP